MKAMGIIFSNIYDSSLGELTSHRTVASLPFGGRYRQIDFVLSNLSNSGIYNIGIITKYNYRSLMDHLGSCADWDLNRKNEGVVFLPPFASGNTGMYKGKLAALHSAAHFINNPQYDYVVVCDSTVLCNMDLRPAIKQHVKSGCDVTVIATTPKEKSRKKYALILRTNRRGRVTELLIDTRAHADTLIGMGVFIFSRQLLIEAIEESYIKGLAHLERDYLQKKFNEGSLKIDTYPFEGVVLWNEDIRSYFANNMALLSENVRKSFFDIERPIYTKVRDEIPTYYAPDSHISDCIIADGCVLCGRVSESIIFRDVAIEKGAEVKNSIIMQGARIGANTRLECVILDKNVTVTEGAALIGTKTHPVIVKKGETV